VVVFCQHDDEISGTRETGERLSVGIQTCSPATCCLSINGAQRKQIIITLLEHIKICYFRPSSVKTHGKVRQSLCPQILVIWFRVSGTRFIIRWLLPLRHTIAHTGRPFPWTFNLFPHLQKYKDKIYHCHYKISNQNINYLSNINTLHERKLCSRLLMSEQSAFRCIVSILVSRVKRCKAIPVTGRGGSQGCEMSRFPLFSRQSAHRWP
jgi:hypothetical protein